MHLKEWARTRDVAYSTALSWFRTGKLPVPAEKIGGLILVDADDHGLPLEASTPERGRTVVYARVSSADQKTDLDRQVARVATWVAPRAGPSTMSSPKSGQH